MRHRKKKNTLDRNTAGRRSLLANLAESLILYEKIKTTKAKAKALSPVVERLITKAKKNSLSARREIKKILYTDNAVKKIMGEIAPRYQSRNGGYIRIISLDKRAGDGAEEAVIELV